MAWVNASREGWPSNFVVTITLTTQRRGGQRVAGRVELFIQKGDDANSRVWFPDASGNPVVADIADGQEWKSPATNFAAWAREGFDTLVLVHEGKEIVRTIIRPPVPTVRPAVDPGRQNVPANQTKSPKLIINITNIDLKKKDDGKKYDVEVTGTVTANGQPHKQADLDFYWKGKIDPKCQLTPACKTDDNGRFSFTFADKPAEGKQVKFEIQLRGGISRSLEVDVPAAPQEKKQSVSRPTTLKATLFTSMPVGNKMRHVVTIRSFDQSGNSTVGGKYTWAVGPVSDQSGSGTMDKSELVVVEVEGETLFTACLPDSDVDLEKPLKLAGPAKPVTTPKPEPDLLEVELATFSNTYGLFAVTVRTFVGEKPVKGKFIVHSADVLSVYASDGTTSLASLETESDGSLELLVGFVNPVQTSVIFKLKNGKGEPQQRLLVKL